MVQLPHVCGAVVVRAKAREFSDQRWEKRRLDLHDEGSDMNRGVRARLAAATAAWVGLARPVRFRHATTHGKLKGRVIIVGAECRHDGRSRSHSRGGFCKFLRCTAGPQELEEFESRTCAWLGVCEEQDRRLYMKPIRVKRVASLRLLVLLGYQGSLHLTLTSSLFLCRHFWLYFQDLLHRY